MYKLFCSSFYGSVTRSTNILISYLCVSLFQQVAMVELDPDKTVPQGMMILFALCTTLLVAVHIMALMISTCILPNLDAVSNLHNPSLVHESPHERFHWCIEVAWTFSTLLGMLLFLFEVAMLCWVCEHEMQNNFAHTCVFLHS